MRMSASLIIIILAAAIGAAAVQAEKVGVRPYELEWAGRTEDDHPPLVDFEDLDGWTVTTTNAAATFERTREQQIWGRYVGKLTYRATGPGSNELRIMPPHPAPITRPFDAVTLWCYGNNWGWSPDPLTPQVNVAVLLRDKDGAEIVVPLAVVNWTEWHLLHRRLSPDQIERVRSGAEFVGLRVLGGSQSVDRVLYFDNLAVFTEAFAPLTFSRRPRRGVAMFPGQGEGTNTGAGTLPFPTRDKTILPPALDPRLRAKAEPFGRGARFTATDRFGTTVYTVDPSSGRWDDIAASFVGADQPAREVRFRPCVDGGVRWRTPAGPVLPDSAELQSSIFKDGTLTTVWRCRVGEAQRDVTYRFRLWGKSLVIDTIAPGGQVAEVRYGKAVGLSNPRLITHPYYPAAGGRPATVCFDGGQGPLFLMGNTDWYRTNSSVLWAVNDLGDGSATYNGGVWYTPLTNGVVNDCFERFFVTLSPRFEETLPVIANPASPWKKVTGTHVWRTHGASDREADKRYWTQVRRYGMTEIIVTDHETMWRDGGESFTFRTKAAPGKGGDDGERDYSRFMQETLGFVYGPYNNFTDFAPVNEYWSTDMIARDPANQLQSAWMRCYAPKPARAVEYCERLSPINQNKFHFSTAYCDVHTAVPPWDRVDYDPRAPGAGTMAAVFYAYGEIMLLQKKAWNGPVYSEGNYHSFYSGLTDGNYGQDQSYRPAENPWLVDFDLRRMHDLGCNFGMGSPDMFYANEPQPQTTPEERAAWLDRFLAATVAFGHPGFLVAEGGMHNALKSYYMLQQIGARYCLAQAVDIRYVDGAGRLLDSSAAIASGAYRRSQIVVRYSDGTVVTANGSRTEPMRARVAGRTIQLLPNGYACWTSDGSIEVTNQAPGGGYADYARTPDYIFVDGRGRRRRFAAAASSGIGVCRRLRDGEWEIIPYEGAECGFGLSATSAVALDQGGKRIGPAALRTARGLTYVLPVEGAFSYLLKGVVLRPPAETVSADRIEVIPGETVRPSSGGPIRIPTDARPGTRLWRKAGTGWLDFTVVEPFSLNASLEGDTLQVDVTSHGPEARSVTVAAGGQTRRLTVRPSGRTTVRFPLGAPTKREAILLEIAAADGPVRSRLELGLRTEYGYRTALRFPTEFTSGIRLRGEADTPGFGSTGSEAYAGKAMCGGEVRSAWAMHPPWKNGAVGSVWVLTAPLSLPVGAPLAVRASVGKRDGSHDGDGILYRLAVVDATGNETIGAEHTVRQHGWEPIAVDLSPWLGQTVRLKLIADPGPEDNSSGDWAACADMRIETLEPLYVRRLDPQADYYRRRPGPYPATGLRASDLAQARRGWLRFSGKGSGDGPYAKTATLNGVPLGALRAAGGAEVAGLFDENVGAPLSPEALRSLGVINELTILNPGRDFFSIGRFWIELEMADGTKRSSEITDVVISQPSHWLYAEGVRIPFDEPIAVEIWFRPEEP